MRDNNSYGRTMRQCGGVIFVLVILAISCAAKHVSYDGYSVYQVSINNTENAQVISKLNGQDGYDFWTEIDLANHKVDIMVTPKNKETFIKFLEAGNFKYSVMIEDVGKIMDKLVFDKNRNSNGEVNSASTYMSYGEILSYLVGLSNVTNPQNRQRLIKLERIGQTSKRKDVFMAKISSDHYKKKPIVLLEAGMHAREWAGPPTVLYLTQQISQNYTANKDMLKDVDIYVIPVTNPDGYEYSRKSDRMWRKTRSEQGGCIGVDGNRNFNHYWGVTGASDNPCSDTFKGQFAFSEKETQNIRNVGIKYGNRILGYVAVHSYGNFLLYPWGYTKDLPEDWERLDECAKSFADAVEKFSGTKYTYGSSSRVLYEAAGGSDDWFKGKIGTPFAYTLELPGSDVEGFNLSPLKLPSVGQETFFGIKSMINCFLKFYKSENISLTNDYDETAIISENDDREEIE